MKITRNTPDVLIVEERPWLLGVAIIGFVLFFTGTGMAILAEGHWSGLVGLAVGIGIGGFLFLLLVRRSQLVLDRARGVGALRVRWALGQERTRLALDGLRAEVERHASADGETFRVVLVQGAARYPLSLVFTDRPGHARLAAAINAWLSGV